MKIALLLYDGFTALDIVGPFDVLSRLPGAEASFVGLETGPIRNDNGRLALSADLPIDEMPNPDLVVVPGGMEGTRRAAENPKILAWLQRAHATSQWTTSVCTGSLILASAGLLEGAPATCHWAARGELESLGATYRPQRFVRHAKVVTAAGVSAGIDMALYLVGEIAGRPVAEALQLAVEYDPQPPFDSGSVEKASPSTIAHVEQLLRRE